MKYKLVLDILYPEFLNKDQIRDMKLDILNENITTEITSDSPIHVPEDGCTIYLGNIEFIIQSKKYSIIDNVYTSSILLLSKKTINIEEKLKQELKQENDSKMREWERINFEEYLKYLK